MENFIVNNKYNKNNIYEILHVPLNQRKGDWNTGYREFQGDYYIFANIGIPGRTGHDYKNEWIGDLFSWEANTSSHISQPSIKALISPSLYQKTYLFTRTNDRNPWTFEGTIKVMSWVDITPVKIIWQFDENPYLFGESPMNLANEDDKFYEGRAYNIRINKYERNPEARRMCINIFGCYCNACNFNFERQYGTLGKNYIHVHHLVPLSEIGKKYLINIERDLIPVCPNCHAMIHKNNKMLTIEELVSKIKFLG